MRRALLAVLVLSACSGSDGPSAASGADTDVSAQDSSSTTNSDTDMPSDTTTSGSDSASTTDVLADASDVMAPVYGPYPAGPYGSNVGDRIPNLKWDGFVNLTSDAISDTKPYVKGTSLDTLRRTARKPYALIHVSEFY